MTQPVDDPKTPYFDARSKGKFTKEGVIKVYAKVPFKDTDGDHAVGSEIEMPYGTAEQQAEVDTMVRYGVLTKTKPKKS